MENVRSVLVCGLCDLSCARCRVYLIKIELECVNVWLEPSSILGSVMLMVMLYLLV